MQETQILKIEEVLQEKGVYIGPTVGVSMLPMLKERRDTIVVRPKTQRLNRLDVALYKRGDAYVLHRVLEQTETGYIIRGDNCYTDEIVPEEAVIGVLTEFFQADKHIFCTDAEYIAYAEKHLKSYPTRRFFVQLKSVLLAIPRKIFRFFFPRKDDENKK